MKYEDLKCEFCDGQGEREVNIDGADVMCICMFCKETGVDFDQLEKFKVSIHKTVQQGANSGQLQQHNVSGWVAYPETRPDKYGKYFVHRKDGKTHWETWNNTGFAYNDKVITHWMEVKPPCR